MTQRNRLSQTAVQWLLVVLLLLSFGLRVYRLGDKSVWWDEGWVTWVARQSFVEVAQRAADDVHPPLYLWLVHAWRWGSGDGEFGLRFLSVAIGLLTVAAIYLLGRRVGSPEVGLLAALLLSISRFSVWWSQEMRMYALAALFATLTLWAAIRLWDRGRLIDWALYVLFALAGLYTLYLFVSVLVVTNLAWLWVLIRAERRREALVHWAAAQLAILLLYVPWLAYALGRIPTWSTASPVALGVFLQIYWTVLTTGIPVNVERYRGLTIPVLAVFVLGLAALIWTGRRHWRTLRNGALLLLGVLLPAGVVYLVSLPREAFFYSPQLAPRYLLIFAPAFYVLLAWGLVKSGEVLTSRTGRRLGWPMAALLVVAVMAAAIYGLWTYYPDRILRDDYKALGATLQAYRRSGDAVVLHNDQDWPIFAYHHPGSWQGIPNGQRITSETAEHYLAPVWQQHDGVWLVLTPYAGINDPQGEVAAWLEARAVTVAEHRFADTVLRFYARTEERAVTAHELVPGTRPPRTLSADVGPDFRLAGYGQPVHEYQRGDTIHLFLYWEQKGEVDAAGEGFEVRLLNKEARVWKRVQVPWPALSQGEEPIRQQVDLVVPPDAPSTTYVFAVQPLSGGETIPFGRIFVRKPQRPAPELADVDIARPLEIDFGEGVRLLGYDIDATTLEPGSTVYLTLYWQARQPVERRYKVFTHLLGQEFNPATGNLLWGQQDNEPVNGTRPTSTWQPGEVIVDSYAMVLDPGAPSGRYAVEIGLYEPATGARLPVLDGEGHVTVDYLILTHLMVD